MEMSGTQTQGEVPLSFSHQQILRVLSGILLCIFLAAIDQTVVIPAVPAMAADLHGFSHLAWIVSAYLLTSTAMTPVYGKLSDIYGERRPLLVALAVFGLASAFCALSHNLWELVTARAVQGIGGAGLMAMSQAAIADVVSPRERGRYQGYMASTWGIASIAGPIVGGWITDTLTWRWIFWCNQPLALIAMLLCDRALRMLRPRAREARIDWAGAVLLTAAVSAWLLVLSWGGVEMPWTAPPLLGLAVLGLLLMLLLVRQERRVLDPLLPPRLFANAVFVRGVAIAFCGSLALFAGSFLLPLFFQLVRGVNAAASGALVVPFLGSNCAGAWLAGSLARRRGRMKGIMIAGVAATLVGFVLLTFTGAATLQPALVAFQLVLGFGIGMVMPSALVCVQNAAERRDVGSATGCLLFLRSMGGAFGTTLVGALLASGFASRLARIGITAHIDLGDIHPGSQGLPGVAPAMLPRVETALAGAFHLTFVACAVAMAIGLVILAGMRDLPLRTSAAGEPPPEPAALAH